MPLVAYHTYTSPFLFLIRFFLTRLRLRFHTLRYHTIISPRHFRCLSLSAGEAQEGDSGNMLQAGSGDSRYCRHFAAAACCRALAADADVFRLLRQAAAFSAYESRMFTMIRCFRLLLLIYSLRYAIDYYCFFFHVAARYMPLIVYFRRRCCHTPSIRQTLRSRFSFSFS